MAGISFHNVSNQSMPPDCQARCIGYVSPLAGVTTDTLDLTRQVTDNHIQQLQAIYIDNSLNGNSVTIQIQGTGQRITCPANSQGWFPALIPPGQEVFDITSSGGVDIPLFVINVPMPAAVWLV